MQKITEAGGEIAGAHARVGYPDAEIVGLAGRLDAGLIVMGSRGLGPLRRALISGEPSLAAALEGGRVMMHPFVLGELACGNLKNCSEVLELLGDLPAAPTATDPEALAFIERRALMGRGIGYIDVHLLASIALSGDARL